MAGIEVATGELVKNVVGSSAETVCYVEDIHADAREATASHTFKAMTNACRPDIAKAILLRAIDDWYKKGVAHGKTQHNK
jgi:hypothetical protein